MSPHHSQSQARVEPGVPRKSGQWKRVARPAAVPRLSRDVSVGGPTVALEHDDKIDRIRHVLQMERAALSTSTTDIDVESTSRIAAWWEKVNESAPVDGYPMMPDSDVDDRAGHSLSGTRRINRRRYTTGENGVDMRMPSVAAIKRFAKQHPGKPIRVPVQAMVDGKNVVTSVLVTSDSSGSAFNVKNLQTASSRGDNVTDGMMMEDTVFAALNARRGDLRRSLHSLGKQHEEYARSRRSQMGAAMYPTRHNSPLSSVGYDGAGTLFVAFDHSETAYAYTDKTADQARAILSSHNPTTYYNSHIRGKQDVRPLGVPASKCADCGRFQAADSEHYCPGGTVEIPRTRDAFNRMVALRNTPEAKAARAENYLRLRRLLPEPQAVGVVPAPPVSLVPAPAPVPVPVVEPVVVPVISPEPQPTPVVSPEPQPAPEEKTRTTPVAEPTREPSPPSASKAASPMDPATTYASVLKGTRGLVRGEPERLWPSTHRGYSIPMIRSVLPFATADHVPDSYDADGRSLTAGEGIVPFRHIDTQSISGLTEHMSPEMYAENVYPGAPLHAQLIEAVRSSEHGELSCGGYIAGPSRSDEGVILNELTLDTTKAPLQATVAIDDLWSEVAAKYRLGDTVDGASSVYTMPPTIHQDAPGVYTFRWDAPDMLDDYESDRESQAA